MQKRATRATRSLQRKNRIDLPYQSTIMPKIQKSSRPWKRFMVKTTNPDTGREKTIHFGQSGSSIKPWTPKAKAFMARHRAGKGGMTAKKWLNEQTWKGKKVGDSVRIPSKYL